MQQVLMQRGCFQDFFGSKHVANIFGSKHFIIFGIRLPNDTLLTVQCRTSGSSDTSLSLLVLSQLTANTLLYNNNIKNILIKYHLYTGMYNYKKRKKILKF